MSFPLSFEAHKMLFGTLSKFSKHAGRHKKNNMLNTFVVSDFASHFAH